MSSLGAPEARRSTVAPCTLASDRRARELSSPKSKCELRRECRHWHRIGRITRRKGSEVASIVVEPARQAPGKGLKTGARGLISSVVIGVASTAPAYSLAATLGFVVEATPMTTLEM